MCDVGADHRYAPREHQPAAAANPAQQRVPVPQQPHLPVVKQQPQQQYKPTQMQQAVPVQLPAQPAATSPSPLPFSQLPAAPSPRTGLATGVPAMPGASHLAVCCRISISALHCPVTRVVLVVLCCSLWLFSTSLWLSTALNGSSLPLYGSSLWFSVVLVVLSHSILVQSLLPLLLHLQVILLVFVLCDAVCAQCGLVLTDRTSSAANGKPE